MDAGLIILSATGPCQFNRHSCVRTSELDHITKIALLHFYLVGHLLDSAFHKFRMHHENFGLLLLLNPSRNTAEINSVKDQCIIKLP